MHTSPKKRIPQVTGIRLIPVIALFAAVASSLQAIPENGRNVANNCYVCHGQLIADQPDPGQVSQAGEIDGRVVTGKMLVAPAGMMIDLGTQLDGEIRGALQAIQAAAGSTVSLQVNLLDGVDNHAVQIKGFEGPGQFKSETNALVWNEANPGNGDWLRQELDNPPFFATGVLGGEPPTTYTFDLVIDGTTPPDIYDLVFATAGKDGDGLFYQEEHFYLQVTPSGAISGGADDKFVNLSTRGALGSTEILTPGFVIGGTQPRKVLIRVMGPTLGTFGVTTACEDPSLTLFKPNGDGTSSAVAQNSKWGDASNFTDIKAAAGVIGAFPFADDSLDAAILVTLQPGAYTVQATCGAGGEVVAEVYDASEVP